ncbi:MAG: AsnC family protein [Fibromonadales bacterium]|nr:AsnC family protein [Fibromonadales bacterium]
MVIIPKTDQKILALIRENPEIIIQEIADLIGLSKIGIGSAKGGYWEIIENLLS